MYFASVFSITSRISGSVFPATLIVPTSGNCIDPSLSTTVPGLSPATAPVNGIVVNSGCRNTVINSESPAPTRYLIPSCAATADSRNVASSSSWCCSTTGLGNVRGFAGAWHAATTAAIKPMQAILTPRTTAGELMRRPL